MAIPAVSVVMRTRNCLQAGYDPAVAIQSILRDARSVRERVELLVLDAGSTDGTRDILRPFGASIKVVERPGRNLIELLNDGIESASAPLLAFMDADDWVNDGFFAGLMGPLLRMSACAYTFSDNLELGLGELTPHHVHIDGNPYLGTGVGGFMFRTLVLREIGGYDADLYTDRFYGFPEYDVLMKIGDRKALSAYVPRPLWTYVRRSGSMSAQLRGRMDLGKEVLRERHGWFPQIREY